MFLKFPIFAFAILTVLLIFSCPAYASEEVQSVLNERTVQKNTAKITWFGHSMFLIEFETVKILFDPYSDIGYPLPVRPISCDILSVSHKHQDHSNLSIAGGAYTLKDSEGVSNICGLSVNMIKSFHDRKKGEDRGVNFITVFDYDNVRFAHLGDLGAFDDELLKTIGRVDVLMIPVGGYYTIDAYDAWEIIRYLTPKIIIPMHYKTEMLDKKIPIDTADKFISGRPGVKYFEDGSCEINLRQLPREEVIYLFKL
ncbi:MAG: metal-dependent hydrolase [bacterium ADurb.Bin243]|nr:MAG: metal-dependent hydrolase [bacterium ADurb.Bin243]